MSYLVRIAGLVVATSLLAGCGWFSDKEEELEPMELVDFDESVTIKRIWSDKLGGESDYLRVALRPTGDGNRVYAASQDGKVSAYDPESGDRLWRSELETELSAGPGAGEGVVVVVAKDGFAVALDAATGVEQWRADVEAESLSIPLIKDDTIVVQTIDNRLQSLSVFDGRQRWSLERSTPALTMRHATIPAAAGNTVIAGFDTGRLVAADLDTGTVLWETLLSPPKGRSDLDRLADIDGHIAVVGQDVYAAGYQGRLAAIAAESGQILWSREISSYVGVAADWNSVYTARDDDEVIALTRRNGDESWRNASLLRRELTRPVPFHTNVVVGDLEGYIHFLSNIDGEMVARERLGKNAITSDPFVMANRLFVQSDSGTIAAYVVVEDRPSRPAPDVAEDES